MLYFGRMAMIAQTIGREVTKYIRKVGLFAGRSARACHPRFSIHCYAFSVNQVHFQQRRERKNGGSWIAARISDQLSITDITSEKLRKPECSIINVFRSDMLHLIPRLIHLSGIHAKIPRQIDNTKV